MDYRTLFLTYIGFMAVYTASACLLALQNRKMRGLSLLSFGLLVGLVKIVLQGLEGKIPVVLSSMVANELYLLSFVLQMLGLRWFVTRSPLSRRWPLYLLACLALIYTALYFERVSYIANLINIPVIFICGLTAWMLFCRGGKTFSLVSQWAAAFMVGEMAVSLYRAALTNLHYAMPWKVLTAQHDPRWLYSLMAMMFFSTCVVMCDFWFIVMELQRELMEQARKDPLTGALNRRALQIECAREIARTLRGGHHLSALLLDIDHFKELNDTRGHLAGDMALQCLVSQINGILRTQDVLARSGGEEFTILLPETTLEHAKMVAERVRCSLEGLEMAYDGHPFHISVSVGVAVLDLNCPSFETLMHHADEAMYTAKHLGRNRVIVYRGEKPRDDIRLGRGVVRSGLADRIGLALANSNSDDRFARLQP